MRRREFSSRYEGIPQTTKKKTDDKKSESGFWFAEILLSPESHDRFSEGEVSKEI
jgi:hypothetical protein